MTETITISNSSGAPYNNLTEEEQWNNFANIFCVAASFQGGAAYFLMSIHAVNPQLITSTTGVLQSHSLSATQQWHNFIKVFYLAASFQGSAAYILMSIHAVNSTILNRMFGFDPYYYIWVTMLYGIGVMIFSRPSMRPISPVNRIAFGILGALMFCHASINCFEWLNLMYPERPYLRTFMGFFSGRIMMVHLLAFLYHMDTRTNIPGVHVRRDRAFEQMYIYP